MLEFIFMLTRDDQTVSDALAVYEGVRATDLRYVGFKDVGGRSSVPYLLVFRTKGDTRLRSISRVTAAGTKGQRDKGTKGQPPGCVDVPMQGLRTTESLRPFVPSSLHRKRTSFNEDPYKALFDRTLSTGC